MKYDDLRELSHKLLDSLQEEVKYAKNEDDFDELEQIAEDLLLGIPTNLIQKDFYKRSDIRTYLDDKDKQDTRKIDKAMARLYDLDTIAFCYDQVNQAIEDDLADF